MDTNRLLALREVQGLSTAKGLEMKDTYAILVTYGNAYPDSRFASGVKTYEDAVRLKDLAVRLGYDDAQIVNAETLRKIMAQKHGGFRRQESPRGQRR